MPTLALRPSVLTSLVLHGGVLLGAAAFGAGGGTRDREAVVFAFQAVEPGSASEAADVPDVADDARPDAPRVEAPVDVEPRVFDPPPPTDDAEVPDEPRVPDADVRTAPAPSPTARTRPVRPPAAGPSAPAAAVLPPPSVAARAGAARVDTFARARPTNRAPTYPEVALRAGWQGVVWLIVEVGADGRVTGLAVERSSGHEVLDAAAVAAVSTWTYDPRVVDGVPAPDRLRLPVRFTSSPASSSPAR